MKKILIPFLSLFLITACGNKTENGTNATEADSAAVVENMEKAEGAGEAADGDATAQTKEGAKAFIKTVYNTYLNPTKEDEDKIDNAEINLFGMAYMDQYMSDILLEKIVDANDKQIADDELFLDYDIWTNSQDNTGLKLKKVNCIEYTGETATLEVILANDSWESKVYPIIEYNKESGRWFVYDFFVNGKKFIRSIDDYLDGEE